MKTLLVLLAAMFGGGPTHLYVYDAPTRRSYAGLRWRFATLGAVVASPAVRDGVGYVGSADGSLQPAGAGSCGCSADCASCRTLRGSSR